MAEWSIAAVLKTVEPQGSGGSNPSLSEEVMKNAKSSGFAFLGLCLVKVRIVVTFTQQEFFSAGCVI